MSLPTHNHHLLNRSITAPTASTAVLSLPQSLLNPQASLTSAKPLLSFSLSLALSLPPNLSLSSRCSRSSSSTATRVSTAPLEYVPPPPDFNFHQELTRLKTLRSRLSKAGSIENKLNVIGSEPRVRRLFDSHLDLSGLSLYEVFLLKCLVAAGQGHVLCVPRHVMERETVESARSSMKSALFALVEMIERMDGNGNGKERGGFENERDEELDKLLKILYEMEQFYDCIGGIIG